MTAHGGRLAGKRVLITGAGSGIGEATAVLFAREGAMVGLLGRTREKLVGVEAQVVSAGGTCLVLPASTADEPAMEAAVRELVETWGGLDACVAVAGIERFDEGDDRADRLDLAVWREIVDINLTGTFITAKHALRAMLVTGGGSLVITGSPTAQYGFALGEDAYSASKAGTHGLARVLANEFARDNIRVNCVIPGFIDTPINARAIREFPDDIAALEAAIPMRRAGHADEVAPVNLWMCSDEASYVSGAFFTVDGGLTAV
jgi:3-oxoacyl-[acyl-carrier protein] reductase